MTAARAEARAEKSRERSAEYKRKRRNDFIIFFTGVFLYVGVPIIWNGAVEFGFVKPITTPQFKNSLSLGGAVILLVLLRYLPKVYRSNDEADTVPTATQAK